MIHSSVFFQTLSGGQVNILLQFSLAGCDDLSDALVLRVYGDRFDSSFFSRDIEVLAMQVSFSFRSYILVCGKRLRSVQTCAEYHGICMQNLSWWTDIALKESL